jgi:hypothetical protein
VGSERENFGEAMNDHIQYARSIAATTHDARVCVLDCAPLQAARGLPGKPQRGGERAAERGEGKTRVKGCWRETGGKDLGNRHTNGDIQRTSYREKLKARREIFEWKIDMREENFAT